MDTFSLEKLPSEPIVFSRAFDMWKAADHMAAFTQAFLDLAETIEEPFYWITDLRAWKADLYDVIVAANDVARSANAIAHHPKLIRFVIISDMKLVELAAKGLHSETFGFVPVDVFNSEEQAFAHVRSLIADGQKP